MRGGGGGLCFILCSCSVLMWMVKEGVTEVVSFFFFFGGGGGGGGGEGGFGLGV